MRKVVAYIGVSLDGYIADKDGGVDWLLGDGSDSENFGSYPEFIETVDTVILGHTTYHHIATELSPDVWPYDGKMSYVLTHKKLSDLAEIKFTDIEISKLISNLKSENGKNIWICGGANIIRQLHEKSLIDEYVLSVIPTILGSGTKLFDVSTKEVKLKLKSTRAYNGIVDLVYEKRCQ